jgi:hypothetical protein
MAPKKAAQASDTVVVTNPFRAGDDAGNEMIFPKGEHIEITSVTPDFYVIRWNEQEKFYHYVEWLKYIIDKILNPRGYILYGTVQWQGEESDDFGKIKVKNNIVYKKIGKRSYGKWKET